VDLIEGMKGTVDTRGWWECCKRRTIGTNSGVECTIVTQVCLCLKTLKRDDFQGGHISKLDVTF
jgi:hypothetical protein